MQSEAFGAVNAADEVQPVSSFGGSAFGGRPSVGRRRPAPAVESVVQSFRGRLEELDGELLNAVGSALGGGPLSQSDVAYALRYHSAGASGTEVAAAEARVLGFDPMEAARRPMVSGPPCATHPC